MNRLLGAAVLGVALLPAAAFAQASPAPDQGPGPGGRPQLSDAQRSQLRSAMEQSRAQMEKLHEQYRAQMLGSLSPVHRTALANIVGSLAIAPSPDYQGAARQIDALLSANERQSVLNAETAFRTQSKALRDQQRQAFLSVLTPDERTQMESRRAQFENGHQRPDGMRGPNGANRRTPDAGELLLRASQPHAMMGFGGMGHRGGFGGPGGPGGN
jgi:Spy/CpxP family protein refolding chaperone